MQYCCRVSPRRTRLHNLIALLMVALLNLKPCKKMKKYFTRFMMLAALGVAGVSCEESPINETIDTPSVSGAVLYVADLAPDTRVSFEDEDTAGIALTWEEDDTFSLYGADGSKVDDFKCTAVGDEIKFESVMPTTQLDDNADYTAIYPKSSESTLADAKSAIDPLMQNGDEINNLDNSLYMLADFTYSEESTIKFEHQMAIMTFKFKSANEPKKLIFENGEDVYTVNYSEIQPSDDIYVSHIMINPCEATERELVFSLYNSADESAAPYEVRKTTSTKAYEAGKRYTASVSDYTEILFSGGDGSESTPYLISTADDMRELSGRVAGENGYIADKFKGKFFEVTADIDLGGEDNEFTAIGAWSIYFAGTFDGDNHTISGLYINQPDVNYQGLFGRIEDGATIKNTTVSGEVTGEDYVGGVVGTSYGSTVINCHNNAIPKVAGDRATVGGVVGWSADESTVINCHNSAALSSAVNDVTVGGVVGYNDLKSTVINCYNSAAASSTGNSTKIGGIVGYNNHTVINCYNNAAVSGTGGSPKIGGVVGYNNNNNYNTTVTNCNWASDATIDGKANGAKYGIGSNRSDAGAARQTLTQMQSDIFLKLLNSNAYDYNEGKAADAIERACAWIKGTDSYPTLDYKNISPISVIFSGGDGSESTPYLISTADDMRELSGRVAGENGYIADKFKGKFFEVTADIDLGGEDNEFTAIGSSTAIYFSGTFDGDNHTISGLYINKPDDTFQGLFGFIMNGATITNLTVSGEVTGWLYVGGIVGHNDSSTIINCHNNVVVSGKGYVGGVVGKNSGATVINCYNNAAVSSEDHVGGIVGCNESSTVINCYNKAAVSSTGNDVSVGGVAGMINNSSTVKDCYWASDATIDGKANNAKRGIGEDMGTTEGSASNITLAQMQDDRLLKLLNSSAYTYNTDNKPSNRACAWIKGADNYPTLDPNDTDPKYSMFSGGVGSASNPFQISTADDMRCLSAKVTGNGCTADRFEGKFFKVTADIDLGGKASEFTAIGNNYNISFSGTFDGAGYTISGLYINKPNVSCQALFGHVDGATIKNLTVSGEITGSNYVGGVVGRSEEQSTVINCHNNATVCGTDEYAEVGGVVGHSEEQSTVINCYNNAAVSSIGRWDSVGGVVGCSNNSTVINCYNSAAVSGGSYDLGGVVGFAQGEATTIDCYWASDATIDGNADNAEYGIGGESNDGATSKTLTELQEHAFCKLLNNNAYTYNEENPTNRACAWIVGTENYPTLDAKNTNPAYIDSFSGGDGGYSSPYLISCGADLRELSDKVNNDKNKYESKYFKLTADIDLGGEANEFTAIGNNWDKSFSGYFDGDGHTISGLYINKPTDGYQGLFGSIRDGATIKNLTVSGKVIGKSYVGGIAGYNQNATVLNCHNKAEVTGSGSSVGGIVGMNESSTTSETHYICSKVANCYNSATITGTGSSIGGIAGRNNRATVTACYNSGEVISSGSAGGIVGDNSYSMGPAFNFKSVVSYCYFDVTVCSTLSVVGYSAYSSEGNTEEIECMGRSTDAMQKQDFVDILNTNTSNYNNIYSSYRGCAWKYNAGEYPSLDFGNYK